jgi:hypothetical protein
MRDMGTVHATFWIKVKHVEGVAMEFKKSLTPAGRRRAGRGITLGREECRVSVIFLMYEAQESSSAVLRRTVIVYTIARFG